MITNEQETDNEIEFEEIARNQFLNGYDESDSVYDNNFLTKP